MMLSLFRMAIRCFHRERRDLVSSQNGRGHFHILFHRRKSALRKGPNTRNGYQPFVFQFIFLYLKQSHIILQTLWLCPCCNTWTVFGLAEHHRARASFLKLYSVV